MVGSFDGCCRAVETGDGLSWPLNAMSDVIPAVRTPGSARTRAQALVEWLRSLKGVREPNTVAISDELCFGIIKFTDPVKEFGFIGTADQGDLFFHRGGCAVPTEFALMKAGVRVSFRPAASEKGRKALEVAIT